MLGVLAQCSKLSLFLMPQIPKVSTVTRMVSVLVTIRELSWFYYVADLKEANSVGKIWPKLQAELLQASDNSISVLLPPRRQAFATGWQSGAIMLRVVGKGKPPTPHRGRARSE